MKKFKAKSGQTLVEFTLVLPLLFILVMGLFDIGRAVFYYAVINTAAREGTRYAVVQPNCDYLSNPGDCDGYYLDSYPLNCENAQSDANQNICDEVRLKLFDISELSNSTITINHSVSGTDGATIVSVDIDILFEPITPGLSLMGDLQLHANSQMMMTPLGEP
jgi:Flp pilus assembly protein TadG